MTKKAMFVAVLGVILAVAAAPSHAQGPFADVPIDHWAYEAVSQLQDHGIVIGYPDGTFSGRRALTRYEFALALSRAIPVILDMVPDRPTTGPATGVTEQQVRQWIEDATADGGPWATPSDVQNLQRLQDEFQAELVQLGVDVDALKRDVAALEERVAAIEAEMQRLRISTKLNFFGYMDTTKNGPAEDIDGRVAAGNNNLLQDLVMVRDADVIFAYQHGETKAKVILNAGNYLNFLGGTVSNRAGLDRNLVRNDDVAVYAAYGSLPVWGADLTVGRFPIQLTKWTLEKIDVDSYTENWKSEAGAYYMDGVKAEWAWGNTSILAFAAKNSGNNQLFGLTGGNMNTLFVDGAGYAEQTAGVRFGFGLGRTDIGATWISVGEDGGTTYEQADVRGVDINIPFGSWNLSGAYTDSEFKGRGAMPNLKSKNAAWEVAADGSLGAVGIHASYKKIQDNFSAPGNWATIGPWVNPTNIQGPEVGISLGLGSRVNLSASGAWYSGVDTIAGANSLLDNKDDDLDHIKAALTFKLGERSSLGLDGEWVKWDPAGVAGSPALTYFTASYNRMITDNSKLRLLYQVYEFDSKGLMPASDYKGAVAVAQVSMDF